MADGHDPTNIITAIGGGLVALLLTGLGLREWFKSRMLTDTNRDAAINGVEINQGVLANINAELERHARRITELEARVEDLTSRLATVRMIAIDCYSMANECKCEDTNKERLLDHLKQIIREA